jgi:hypothetical protein
LPGKDLKFAIKCDDEASVLSNSRLEETWKTLDDLILILLRSSDFSSEMLLFAWKREPGHLASAREPYAWRAALEEIKNSDLSSKCQGLKGDGEKYILITDKPAMLKVAGEITSALLHSYTSRHRISFAPV